MFEFIVFHLSFWIVQIFGDQWTEVNTPTIRNRHWRTINSNTNVMLMMMIFMMPNMCVWEANNCYIISSFPQTQIHVRFLFFVTVKTYEEDVNLSFFFQRILIFPIFGSFFFVSWIDFRLNHHLSNAMR